MGTRDKQNCCRQQECSCPPVPPWKTTQNNPAEPPGQHKTNEFKWFSFQMTPTSMIGAKFSRKAIFQGTLGPPQHRTASWTNLYLPFFQLLRPRFATSHQFTPRILDNPCSKLRTMQPGLVTRASPCISPLNCSMPRMGGVFPSHMLRPSIHSCQRSVPQGREVLSASQRLR